MEESSEGLGADSAAPAEAKWWAEGDPALHPSRDFDSPPRTFGVDFSRKPWLSGPVPDSPTPSLTSPNPSRQSTFTPVGERRFYAIVTMVAVSVFLLLFTVIATSAIPNRNGRPVGIAALVVGVLMTLWSLRAPYVAIVKPDGTLTFRSLTGSVTTAVQRVSQVRALASGRGQSWVFYFDGGKARLTDVSGRALARYLISQNPSINCQPRQLRLLGNSGRPWCPDSRNT